MKMRALWFLLLTVPAAAQFVPPTGPTPGGPCGGDTGGTYPNCTVLSVAHVNTGTLGAASGGTGSASVPTAGQIAVGNGSAYIPNTVTGSCAISSTGTLSCRAPLSLIGSSHSLGQDLVGAATDIASGSRQCMISLNQVSTVTLAFAGVYNPGAGTITNYANSVMWRAAIEYPVGSKTIQASTPGGLSTMVLKPGAIGTMTASVNIPAGSTFCVRTYERAATPPTSPSVAVSALGGLLSTSTSYFYKVTAVDNGIESGPTSEVTCATSSSTSCALTWTVASNATPSTYNIYRATTTGNEVLVATVAAPTTGWVDQGASTASTTAPPSGQLIYFAGSTDSGNSTQGTGNNADLTASTGGLTTAGPSSTSNVGGYLVLGNDPTSHPVIGVGDSIEAGVGVVPFSSALASGSYATGNWFNSALAAGTWNVANLSWPGGKAEAFYDALQNPNWVTWFLQYATGAQVVSNLGINDVNNATSWQNIALYNIALGTMVHAVGGKFYITTTSPNTTSTDNFLVVANQTVTANEAIRTNRNLWIRNGMQVTGGTPCNTAACGTPTTAIDGYFDLAAAMGEVNSSGVPTNNGGFWPAPSVTPYTGITLTGSPSIGTNNTTGTFTFTTTPGWVTGSQGGCLVTLTSGAQSGKNVVIKAASSTSALTIYGNAFTAPTGHGTLVGLTVAPVAGDTANVVCGNTYDGIHPSYTGHQAISTVFATWRGTNLVP